MQSSIQLLHKALALNPNGAEWCRQLGMSRAALSTAHNRGRLSPTIAGNLARLLGEDVEHWIAVAALEGESPSYGRQKLMSIVMRNS